jgi:hypothetical protein
MRSPNVLRLMIAVLTFALCGGPELLQGQEQTTVPQTTPQQQENTTAAPVTSDQAAPAPSEQDQNSVGTTQQNATPDPSKGPLKPEETLPNAPSTSQQTQQTAPTQPAEAPAGAAAAKGTKTAGGAASRPAGTAIAPAKQHQTRSLLIKVGAIAAGAAALGTIYALSRSSPSTPPGAQAATTPAH